MLLYLKFSTIKDDSSEVNWVVQPIVEDTYASEGVFFFFFFWAYNLAYCVANGKAGLFL